MRELDRVRDVYQLMITTPERERGGGRERGEGGREERERRERERGGMEGGRRERGRE